MKALKEADIVDAVREARDRHAPIEIVGNGTKRAFGRDPVGEPLDVSGVAGIISYEPEELIVTARPATALSELIAVLSGSNQRLGFDPPEWSRFFGSEGESTLGGLISVDAAGPARVRYGGARDHLLGIRAVNGFGETFKAGGRVVKNVTGFDIPKLVCGAFGTLCILTEVTLRVFPRPALSTTLVVRDIAPANGLALLRRVWSSPLESTGLSYLPGSVSGLATAGSGVALIRLEGARRPLEEKLALARSLLAGLDVDATGDGDAVLLAVGNGSLFEGSSLAIWRVYIPPAQALTFVCAVEPSLWLADWAGGLLWIGLDGHDKGAWGRLKTALGAAGGQAILMRSDACRDRTDGLIQPLDKGREMVTRAVKAAFDPDLLFNRRRMFEGF
jgi:glycolate oxidase FAD binding subunit